MRSANKLWLLAMMLVLLILPAASARAASEMTGCEESFMNC